MNSVKRFEDLQVWKESIELSITIYQNTLSEKLNKDFVLREQIRKSAISIPSNIAEGFESDSKNQFIYFLQIAKGSSGELRIQLKIAESLRYITLEQYNLLKEKCLSISKQFSGFINYLKKYQSK